VTVEELGTGDRFTVHHVRMLLGIEPSAGEVWYARRVGSPDHSIIYTSPYVFGPEARTEFRRAMKKQKEEFSRSSLAELFPPERHFAESQKDAAPFWAWYILYGPEVDGASSA
jgi:hypothetical protein